MGAESKRRNSEFMPRRSIWKGTKFLLKRILVSFLIAPVLWDWGLAWVAPLVVFFEGLLDWVLSFMDGLPLSVGGSRNDAGPSSSRRPVLDLNSTPEPELDLNVTPPEPEAEPAAEPPAPLSFEEEHLRTKREDVKWAARILMQIGYGKRGRNEATILTFLKDLNIEGEGDETFLAELQDHLEALAKEYAGTEGQPRRIKQEGLKELLLWVSEKRGN